MSVRIEIGARLHLERASGHRLHDPVVIHEDLLQRLRELQFALLVLGVGRVGHEVEVLREPRDDLFDVAGLGHLKRETLQLQHALGDANLKLVVKELGVAKALTRVVRGELPEMEQVLERDGGGSPLRNAMQEI